MRASPALIVRNAMPTRAVRIKGHGGSEILKNVRKEISDVAKGDLGIGNTTDMCRFLGFSSRSANSAT